MQSDDQVMPRAASVSGSTTAGESKLVDTDLILQAIAKGGGPGCDAEGVVRALKEAGFAIWSSWEQLPQVEQTPL